MNQRLEIECQAVDCASFFQFSADGGVAES